MNQLRPVSCWQIFCLLLGLCASAWSNTAAAQAVGTVVQLTGTLSAQRGTATRILSLKSEVQRGDTLVTQASSYAQVQFTDNSTVTLRPNTTLRLDEYQFNQKEPGKDSITMNLLKGGLRSVTGLIGKCGNQDAYKIQTSTATIGIRGSEGEMLACAAG